MSVYGVGETYNYGFSTYNASSALAAADGLPTGVLVVGGTDTAATVTVTASATGRHKIAVSLAGRSVGDDCYVRFSATVGGVTQEGRTPPFRVAFPAALTGGLVTIGSTSAPTALQNATATTDRFATIYTATATINANVVSFTANAITSAAFLIGSVTKTSAGFIEYLMFTEKWDRAKKVKDATTGVITGYDTDGATPIGTRTFTEPSPTNESVGPLV
jgi:hypothetical protein